MKSPTVSFVIPCYNLAHLLRDCICSILSQSYRDFEVLVMDDCSPDNTKEVAQSFGDSRVKYIRNDTNLGAIRNYNQGISLSSGKYVWLISADDYLRTPDVLQRYVDVLSNNPRVGYVFCPGVGVINGRETGILDYTRYANHDQIVNGHMFLQTLLSMCFILAPSAMVRRECYEKISLFPTNIVLDDVQIDFWWGGDWYLWCVFALFFDVAYFAEPMVCYREHELSSTTFVTSQRIDNCGLADIAVTWMVKQKAEAAGLREVYKICLHAVANEYARHLTGKKYRSGTSTITLDQFEHSLCQYTQSQKERNQIRARVYASVADRYYFRGDLASSKEFYWAGLKHDPIMAKVYVKLILLSLGKAGDVVRLRLHRMNYLGRA
jgi:glycosyltransferase involved in cell wall biosynthesis